MNALSHIGLSSVIMEMLCINLKVTQPRIFIEPDVSTSSHTIEDNHCVVLG